MLQYVRGPLAVLSLVTILCVAGAEQADDWTPLFNGKDLTGWETWLGRLQGVDNQIKTLKDYAALSTLSEEKQAQVRASLDELSKGLKDPVGLDRDPTKVYSVVQVDGQPAIRVSGEIFGAVTTKEDFENYHLKLEFKWGTKRWPPRETAVRDSGLLYHCVGKHGAAGSFWMQSLECQIQERDCGDFWSVAGGIVDVEGERKDGKGAITYKKGGMKYTVGTGDGGSRIIKDADYEKKTGEWNTIELLTVGQTNVHLVNGKVNMVLTNGRRKDGGKEVPLTRGKIQLQSEGAEVFYRNIVIKPLKKIPDEMLR